MPITWSSTQSIAPYDWRCGYCDREVSSNRGYAGEYSDQFGTREVVYIAICSRCNRPTFVQGQQRTPGSRYGEPVDYLPDEIGTLYTEAREAMRVSAYTAAVMVGRKILMNIAVEHGAKKGESFKSYVDHLASGGIVTDGMKDWVDEIRELGNDANHEIALMDEDQAKSLLTFVTMLLKVVYEFPEHGRQSVAARKAKEQQQP